MCLFQVRFTAQLRSDVIHHICVFVSGVLCKTKLLDSDVVHHTCVLVSGVLEGGGGSILGGLDLFLRVWIYF